MRTAAIMCCLILALSFPAFTQDEQPEPARDQAPPPRPAVPTGDVLRLKSGAILEGVQVLRRTPAAYVVEILEGINLEVPTSQVVAVEYDDVEPLRQRRRRALLRGREQPHLVAGRQIASDLYEKLTAPISDSPLKYDNKDFVAILEELGTLTGVAVTVDDPVAKRPQEQRRWSVDAEPGTTLISLLEDLKDYFQDIVVVYRYETVLVTTREAARALESGEEAPATETGEEDDEEDDESS